MTPSEQWEDFGAARPPGRLLWVVSIALLVLAVAAFLYLYEDALHGYHDVLPVYVFAGVGVACAVVWSYLVAILVRESLRGR